MTNERIRIFSDGKLQLLGGKHPSRLFDPFREEREGSFYRWIVAIFDHGFNKFHEKKRKLYRDEDYDRLAQMWQTRKYIPPPDT